MPRKALNFPRKAQRKELLEQLREMANNQIVRHDQDYKDYLNAWVALDQQMDALSAEDEFGVPKVLEEKDADDLADAMMNVAAAGEKFYTSCTYNGLQNSAPAVLTDQFQNFLSKDFETVKSYNPEDKKLTLNELLDKSRTTTIDIRDRNLGSLSNMSNERIPMTVVNARGEQRPGVFTKPLHVDVKARYLQVIEDAKAACGDENAEQDEVKKAEIKANKETLDKYLSSFRNVNANIREGANGKKLRKEASDELALGHMLDDLDDHYNNNPISNQNMRSELAYAGLTGIEKIPDSAIDVLAKGMTKLKDDVPANIYSYQLELPDGARLDNRNGAFTAVSDAFGFKDLAARSEPMKFIGENGEEIEGTFMEGAKGVDLSKKPKLFNHVAENFLPSNIQQRGKLFKQISDLQVMDYICMNKDRHWGNLFYDIDKTGKLVGIQAIDNDSSFGTTRHKKQTLSTLKVVTKSTADKIQHMTPEMLKFALRGHGLTDKELDQAGQRLLDLKDELGKKIKVVDDDQIGRKDIKEFYPPQGGWNIFKDVNDFMTNGVRRHRNPNEPFKPMPDQKPNWREVPSLDRRYTIRGLTDSLGKVTRWVDSKEHDFHTDKLFKTFRGASGYFRDLVTSAKATSALQREINEDESINKNRTLVEQESQSTVQRVDDSFDTLEKKANAYLTYKLKNTKVRPRPKDITELRGKNDYEQSHIDYAKNILKTVHEYRKTYSRIDEENLQANQEHRELETRREERKLAQPQQGGPQLPGV